ncbi:hypothetical protein PHLH4_45940 [Pseudomonas sp. St316]|nr:hypothetical protein PHLH4_45940 [Pseudomonas sp. St316]
MSDINRLNQSSNPFRGTLFPIYPANESRGEGACSRLSAKRSQEGLLRSPAGASSLATYRMTQGRFVG